MSAPCRSFLFAPADHPHRAGKALRAGADAAILDLEDAVAIAAKPAARSAVVALLEGAPRTGRRFVRVNGFATEGCHPDLDAVVCAALDGIVLPKLETTAELVAVDWMLSALERARGLPPRGIELMPLLETALGQQRLAELARAAASLGGRVRRLAFGAADYTLDLGLAWDREEVALAPMRAALAVASRAAGLDPPVDTVWIDLADQEGYEASCRRGAAAGFEGRLCIHPAQLEGAHAAYSPAPAEMQRARRIVDSFREAEAAGRAAIQVDGRFVDAPIVARARRLLALAERIAAR